MAKRKSSQEANGDGGTAVAEPPKKRGRPAKQPMLNDDPAFQRIKELEDLADALDAARSQRQALLADETELQTKLAAAMRKHNCETYKAQAGMLVLEHEEKDKVKIKKPKESDASDD